jgi:hypothetical protein
MSIFKNQSTTTNKHIVFAATVLTFACATACAQSQPDVPQSKAGAGRGLVNPFVESLTIAKDSVMATANKMVDAAVPDAKATNEAVPLAVAGPTALKAPSAPQMKPLAANPSKPPVVDTEGAINPLSGKSFSEEQLQRVLNANKLVTEIGRQQVEQGKNLVELSKTAADSRQIDSAKQRSDNVNIIQKKEPIKPVKVDESLAPGEQVIGSSYPQASQPMLSGGGVASGTVQIGGQSFTPQSRFDGQQARVVYVDAQPSKAAQQVGSFGNFGNGNGNGNSIVPAPVLAPLQTQFPQ